MNQTFCVLMSISNGNKGKQEDSQPTFSELVTEMFKAIEGEPDSCLEKLREVLKKERRQRNQVIIVEENTSTTLERKNENDEECVARERPEEKTQEEQDDEEEAKEEERVNKRLINQAEPSCQKTVLHIACERGDDELTTFLLEQEDIRVDIFNKEGMLPIHCAARKGNVSCTKHLIQFIKKFQEKKGDHYDYLIDYLNFPCTAPPYKGFTSLHFTCMNYSQSGDKPSNREEMVQVLLNSGAHADATTEQGDTALHISAKNGGICSPAIAKLLFKAGCDINAQNKSGITPLMIACTVGNELFANTLLDRVPRMDDDNFDDDDDDEDTNNNGYGNELGKNQKKQGQVLNLNLTDCINRDSALHFAFQSQLQRVFPNGMEITPSHERVAYRLSYCGIDINLRSKDNYLATDFCSDALKHILKMVNGMSRKETFPTSYRVFPPPHLNTLIQTPIPLLESYARDLEPQKRREFIVQIQVYKEELRETEEMEAKKGGCPMSSGNVHLMRKRRNTTEKTQENASGIPFGHPPLPQGDSQAKCPFGFGNDSKSNANTSDSSCPMGFTASQQNKEERSNPSSGSSTVPPSTSKCPIPFHKEISLFMNPRVWLLFAIFYAVSRIFMAIRA